MKKTSETIVFFGSGPVAARSLEKLAKDFSIEAIVTKPRPSHHRGSFPVLDLAESLDLKVLTTTNKRELTQLFKTRPVNSRLGIVIDYGIIIEQSVIDYFELGIINSHFSLLPHLRGADPISFAILNGDDQTGVSLMLIVQALDEGSLIGQASLSLPKDITAPELTEILVEQSHDLLVEALPKYIKGEIEPYPQPKQAATYSRKLTKADAVLDWNKTAAELERQVRAFLEWPRSRTAIGGVEIIVTKARCKDGKGKPGDLLINGKEIGYYTSDGILVIERLLPLGKKEMSAQAFLAGHSI